MRHLSVLFLLLACAALIILAAPLFAGSPSSECPTCEELSKAPQTGIFVLVRDTDPSNKYLDIVAYYDNLTASPTRQPLKNSIIIVEVANASGLYELRKTYTDDNGTARFSFEQWDQTCLNFKAVYCPFCMPPDAECSGFKQCLDFALLKTDATKASEIDDATDAHVLTNDELNPARYLPQRATASWCPPPAPSTATPAICLPLIIIFSLLSGALYLTGRNPFAGFNIGGMRVGQHIRYQARGRGFSFSVTQALMAAASVIEAGVYAGGTDKATGKSRGLGGLAKREWAAAKARGVMGIGTIKQVKTTLGKMRADSAAARSAEKGGARAGVGAGGAVSGGRSSSSATSSAPGGLQFGAAGMSGVSGRDIIGGHGLLSTLGRLAVFIAMSSTLGRSIDAIYSAATFDDRAGRGRSVFEAIFVNNSARAFEAAQTVSAMRGPNGGWIIVTEDGRTLEVKGERQVTEGGRTYTELIVAAPRGTERGQTTDGQIVVRLDSNNVVVSLQMNVFVPQLDKQGRPMTNPDGSAMGTTQTYQMTANASGQWTYSVVTPVLDKSGQPVLNPDGTPQRTVTAVPPQDLVSVDRALSAATSAVPVSMMPGQNNSDFMGTYRDTMGGIANLQSTFYTESVFGITNAESAVNSGLGSHPESRPVVVEAQREMAVDAWSPVLGESTATMDASHPDAARYFTGVGTSESSVVGQQGSYVTGAARFSAAVEGGGIEATTGGSSLVGGGHVERVTIGTLGTTGGTTSLMAIAGERGVQFEPQSVQLTNAVLPGVLAHVNPAELASMTPTQLADAARAAALGVTPQQLASMSSAQVETATATAASRMGITVAQFNEGIRDISALTPELQRLGNGVREQAVAQGFNPSMVDRIMHSDVSALTNLAEAGRNMADDRIPAVLAARPDVLNNYNMADEVAQAARQWGFLNNAMQASGGFVTNIAPPGSDTPVYAMAPNGGQALERFLDAHFDFSQTAMVNAAQQAHAFAEPGKAGELSEYGQATRGLDSGTYYGALTATTLGDRPSTNPPELVAGATQLGLPIPPPPIVQAEDARREAIVSNIDNGDYGTARAQVGQAVQEFTLAARSARAMGDESSAKMLEHAAEGYGALYTRINESEQTHTCPDLDLTGTLGDSATVALSYGTARDGHRDRRHEDLIEVKERIEARLPSDKRPSSLYAETPQEPLTPEQPGRVPRDST